MRQVWITKTGAPDVLKVRESADPEVGPGQVRIRVKAAGINFADLMARVGLYPDAPPVPCVVGYEVSGLIDQVGSGVTGIVEGERVFGMPKFGGYTDTLLIAAEQVQKMPDGMSFEEAAALPVNYITAHTMMFVQGTVRPGSTIFIHSAAGGVGIAAIQLAKTRGCTIIGTASPPKHAYLRAQGVHHPIDSAVDWAPQLRDIVGARGVDLILDPVGGPSWKRGYDLLAPCGRLVCFGLSAAAAGNTRSLFNALMQVLQVKKFSPLDMMSDNRTISGCTMGHLFSHLDLLTPQFGELMRLYSEGLIKPHVDSSFSFENAPKAHQFIHDRKAIGKVLLTP
jgi:NADPH:quinone reductase-like Zn-dependent oxidoreductase